MKRCTWLAACLLLARAVQGGDPLPATDQLQLADGLFARAMVDLAVTEYEAVLKAFPTNAQADAATYRLGECYRTLKRFADADSQFKRVVDNFPNSEYRFRAGFRRADIYMETANPKAAFALYQELLAANPPADITATTLYFLADAAQQIADTTAAEAALLRIHNEFPQSEYHAYALLKLGEIRTAQTMTSPGDDIVAMYEQALTNAPTDRVAAESLFQLAEAHFARGTFDQSAMLYQRLIAAYPQDPRAPRARLRGAWAAHNAGLYAEALRITDESLAAASDDTREDWLYLKANCQRQLVRDADALAVYDALLAAFPNGRLAGAARFEKALTFYRTGKYDEAVALAKDLPLTLENRKDVYWLLAESYSALKRDDDAVQYYRLIATEFPKSDVAADANYRLAYHLQQRGDAHEAARFFAILATDFPEHTLAPQALLAAGFCQADAGKDVEAVQLWTRLATKYPDDKHVQESLYRKALGEIRLDRRDQSVTTLRDLLARFPSGDFAADAHFWQGVLLRETDDLQSAERELRAALEAKPRVELERECQLHLALILHARGEFEETAKLLQPLLASPLRGDLTPTLLQWLAEYEFAQEHPERSAAAAQTLIDGDTGPAGRQIGWTLLGRARSAQNQPAEAILAFEKALACDARTAFGAEAALRLAELKLDAKDDSAATTYFERAAALAVDESMAGLRARAYAGLGRTAVARGDSESAARYFMSVAVLYDDAELVPESLYEAARALQQQGRPDDAQRAVDELRQRYPNSPWMERANALTVAGQSAAGVQP